MYVYMYIYVDIFNTKHPSRRPAALDRMFLDSKTGDCYEYDYAKKMVSPTPLGRSRYQIGVPPYIRVPTRVAYPYKPSSLDLSFFFFITLKPKVE